MRTYPIHSQGQFVGFVVACAFTVGLLAMGCKSPTPAAAVRDSAVGDANSAGGDVVKREDASRADHPDAPGPSCSSNGGAASKGKAEACICDSECRSGFCVDGVCCTSDCTEGCKACNLPSSLGDCSFIPAGVKPGQSIFCSASTPGSCGQDGTCDGKGACRKFVAGIECKPGTCDGNGVSGAKACDGNGNCSQSISTPCGNYACESTTNQCAEKCTTNAQCAAGQQCALQSCGMKLTGFGCEDDSDCASGHCADGKCCNVACKGTCLSCNQPGSPGRCKFVDEGLAHSACKTSNASTCGTTGRCDGAGSCALFPENTPCGAASCAGAVLLDTARVCDGQGTCRAPQLVDCSPYLCSAGGCNGSCVSDSECEPGHQCVATTVRGMTTGRCGQKKNGQSCASASDCESSQCVDGVCCESACEGACRSCGLPGSPGQCVNVASGAADPRKTCGDKGKPSCGTNGVCDGNGACQKYAPGTVCGTETCLSGAFTPAGTCNQSGQCVTPPSLTCNPFTCNGPTCYGSCSTDSQCVAGSFCIKSSCGLKPPGAQCSLAKECQSGYCAQGTCCNSECTGACMACNLSASLGLCTAVADGAPDPQEKCKATPQNTCGTTGLCKAGACANFTKGLNCKDAACATASSETPASACDGIGACVTPPTKPCGTYICSSAACKTSCGIDADCVTPTTCAGNSCGFKANGASCTAGAQCTSTFCTEGICCDKACSDATTGGLCMSCKVSGKVGTCSPVPAGGADPKKLCVASNAIGGDCSKDGTCNGAGACRPWSTATGCRLASCGGSTLTKSSSCDGSGHCPAPTTQACNPYQCNASNPSCLTTCTSDANCTDNLTCLKTTNQCGDKLPPGRGCKANTDCLSNICTEDVCCATACTGACQSCAIPNNVGTCSSIPVNGTPRDGNACPANLPCGNTAKCDGSGGCQLSSAGTTCGAAACAPPVSGTLDGAPVSQSLARVPAPTCNGTGTCVAGTSVSCGNFQCNASDASCKSSCTSSSGDCNSLAPSTADPNGGNSCVSNTCQKKPNGNACTNGYACISGNCVGGTCCASATCDDSHSCTTDSCSSGACTHTATAGNCVISGVCYAAGDTNPENQCQQCLPTASQTSWSSKQAGAVCRAATGLCDTAEICDGTGAVCPADAFAPATSACRASVGVCDVAEYCTGTSAACPADSFASSSTVCGSSSGVCDVAATCSGGSATCPSNTPASSSIVCRAAAGPCDVDENCTGTTRVCPADIFATSSRVCGSSSGDLCDVAATCSGGSATCPGNTPALSSTVCRAAAGVCDVEEKCTGTTRVCPDNSFAAPSMVCGTTSGDLCDVAATCSGGSATCPDNTPALSSMVCRAAAGVCDVEEKCTGTTRVCPENSFAASSTVCGSSSGDLCDVAARCSGGSAPCPGNTPASSSIVCRAAAGPCDVDENCTGTTRVCPVDSFVPLATVCRAAVDLCDVTESCTGSSAACPADLSVVCASGSCNLQNGQCQ